MCHRWDSKPAGRQPVGQEEDRWTCDAERWRGSARSSPSARSRSAPAEQRRRRQQPRGGGTVNIAINPWVGYEADAAVVGYLRRRSSARPSTRRT